MKPDSDEQNKNQQEYLHHLLKNIPHKPGIYKMKDEGGRVIYVGKAKNLYNRVNSYFQNRSDKVMRTLKMVDQIRDIQYVVVGTELEALLLETHLIKELRPKYNVLMKDDKNYVYVKITVQDLYPKIYLVRKVFKDKARYIGPKTAAYKVINTLKALKKIFPFRNCQLAIDYGVRAENRATRVLGVAEMEYHKKHCIGPCVMSVGAEEYRAMVDQVIEFFEGKHEAIIKKIREDMYKAAADKKFELAATIRDRLKAVEDVIEPQRISDPHQKDLDIVHYIQVEDKVYFNLFQLRGGKLLGQENFIFHSQMGVQSEEVPHQSEPRSQNDENCEALNAFLEQYYEKTTDIPKEILIPHEVDEPEMLENWLTDLKGSKVVLVVPERGKKNHLLELSFANAQSFAKQSEVRWQGREKGSRIQALEELQKLLELSVPPKRLECYDISHFGGTETVSSMVVFENGFPLKADYRHFKLHQQTSGEPNDFASMEETLERRLKYLKPALFLSDWSVRKSTKKEKKEFFDSRKDLFPLFQKEPQIIGEKSDTDINSDYEFDNFQYYLFEKDKKYKGRAIIFISAAKKALLYELALEEDVEPLMLAGFLKKILEKQKISRLYIRTLDEQKPLFEAAGCQEIKKIPDGFPQDSGQILVYDKLKFKDDPSFKKRPDLLIIDGGKGQLSSALKALTIHNLTIPICSIAKREEEIFVPGKSNSLILPKDSPTLLMIQNIRNEAHRFAITYHQNLRLQATTSSVLDTIPGLGPELSKKLLRHFGSVQNVKQATMNDLALVVGKKRAITVIQQLGK